MAHTNQRITYLMNEAAALFAIRKYSEAIMVYKMVLKVDPLYAEAYTKKSMAHLFLNQFADSFSCLDAALIHDPDHLGALSGKVIYYYAKQKTFMADQINNHYLQKNPWGNFAKYLPHKTE